MVNRLDLLHMQIRGPELQAVTKLLDALWKDMHTEVHQKLLVRFAHTDDWTVRRAGNIAEEIERNAAELSLYTGKSTGSGGSNNNAPGESGSAPAARSDQRTCYQCGKVGHVKRTCPDLNSGAIVNAHYANAPAKQNGQDLSNVECYTCHKKGHYSNKCLERQPGGLSALVRMASLGAHTTKRIRTAVRNAGTCTPTLKIRVADGRRVKGNNLMPGAQRLQIVEVRVLPVERSCRRCLRRSC
jgi:hypothetical protein